MVSTVVTVAVFLIAGMLISLLGSISGLGGGFLCVPFLVVVWGLGREEAVLLSLTMILANSASASFSYMRSRMVDMRVAFLLILTAIPGLVLGYFLLESMEAVQFDILFSILLVVVNIYILFRRTGRGGGRASSKDSREPLNDGEGDGGVRKLSPYISMPVSFLAGVASSAFGIGGGALLMPLQVGLLKMNIKRAIGTSMFLIMLMTSFRVLVISRADFDPWMALPLALGAVMGAQVGARIVKRVKARYLLYILSFFLFVVALYMGGRALFGLLQ